MGRHPNQGQNAQSVIVVRIRVRGVLCAKGVLFGSDTSGNGFQLPFRLQVFLEAGDPLKETLQQGFSVALRHSSQMTHLVSWRSDVGASADLLVVANAALRILFSDGLELLL